MSINPKDFYIAVSISDLVMWKGDEDVDCVGNPFFIQALNILEIHLDPVQFYFQYVEELAIGTGDVYLYKQDLNGESIFAINLFKDVYDQLDIISFGIRTKKNALDVRVALRAFFDSATYQVQYEEGNRLVSVSSLMDESKYPRKIDQNSYVQNLVKI